MKIIVTHVSPDLDAITAVWLIRKFLPAWDDAKVEFVSAGDRIHEKTPDKTEVIENIDGNQVIHVDTGLGALDHHHLATDKESAASITFKYIKKHHPQEGPKWEIKVEAIERMVKIVVDVDHFKEVFWSDPTADYYDFSLVGLIDGLKLEKPNDDEFYIEFGLICLDGILSEFENKIWAEKEIKQNGIEFETRFGKGIGIESVNDAVIKLSQKMGYVIAVRKDPRKGYVRIKARPSAGQNNDNIDLTLVYEKLQKSDPQASWFLHVNRKMLLNGSSKSSKMHPSKLSLQSIIEILKGI